LKFSLAVTAFDIFNEDEWRDEKNTIKNPRN
jgi:hypothetical protein